MQRIQTEVLVIGGGATGTGVLRDLAMRGFKALLVEKGDLSTGTTGRYHGLLHSGGRYVVKDPQAACECLQENGILRRIMPHCLEDTGGYFVLTPSDEPGYAEKFVQGCRQARIPMEEVPVHKMLAAEPLLNPQITRCFHVPDAAADSFLASQCNAASAREYGAEYLTYHKVTQLLVHDRRVLGARLLDQVNGEEIEVLADMTVNASGAWVGQVCAMAGLSVTIIPGKGTMLALNQRILHTVVNRCKLPSDGDILVPIHTVTVIGTTDVRVDDPDHFAIEPWEVQLMLAEGEKLVPGFSSLRILRAWAGVRPLFQEYQQGETRDVSRAFVLLDHQSRDGLAGLVSITSGKWTTYRKMAEVTVDLVCRQLGVSRPCRTHLEPLPDTRRRLSTDHPREKGKPARMASLGERLAEIEAHQAYGNLVCECELATIEDVTRAVLEGGAQSIDDIRRQVRLGMGPCQGGFCTYRAAGLLHELRQSPVSVINSALIDFLLERWKGLLPVLWGAQLRQERLDELIYLSLLNADHLPGISPSPFTPELYESAAAVAPRENNLTGQVPRIVEAGAKQPEGTGSSDLLVIGGGLSGLCAAWQAAIRGKHVQLLSHGQSSLYFHSGCVDVLGYYPSGSERSLPSPAAGLRKLVSENPGHPYALAGEAAIIESLNSFQALCEQADYPLVGSLDRNWLLPTALGSVRPTCLAPLTMTAGDAGNKEPLWVVGFAGFRDFYPSWIAANLQAQGFQAAGVTIELPHLRDRKFINSRTLADLFDAGLIQDEINTAIRKQLASSPLLSPSRLAFPAVLGLQHPLRVKSELERLLDLPVFEIPTLPPSIPGMRLAFILEKALRALGGTIHTGLEVTSAEVGTDGHLARVWTSSAARSLPHTSGEFVLATGGILGGGFSSNSGGEIHEQVFGLPLDYPAVHQQWFSSQFLSPKGHPVFRVGVQVDRHFQPVDAAGQVLYPNLYAAGAALGGFDPLLERSFDGVALVSGCAVGKGI